MYVCHVIEQAAGLIWRVLLRHGVTGVTGRVGVMGDAVPGAG